MRSIIIFGLLFAIPATLMLAALADHDNASSNWDTRFTRWRIKKGISLPALFGFVLSGYVIVLIGVHFL